MTNYNVPGNAMMEMENVVMTYHELQGQLSALVGQLDSPYTPQEMIRHACEGSIKLYDAVILAELIASKRPARILEVGGFIGFSTRWLLEMSRQENATVVSIDPNIRHRVFEQPAEILRQFNSTFLGHRLVTKCGFFSQRITGNYSYDYEHYLPYISRNEVDAILDRRPVLHAGNLDEGRFDLIFIDGDHCKSAVLSNFREALNLLNPQGRVVFHDAITWPDVGRGLEEIATDYRSLGEVEVLGRTSTGPCDGIGVFHLY
jgi:predicted O-methyltransferase YrrM